MPLAPRHRRIGALVVAAQVLVALDGSLAVVALPAIGRDLELSLGQLAWIQNAYALGLASLLLLAGRAVDLWTAHRVFVLGAWAFAVAAVVGGTAANGTWVAVGRGLAGLAAALVFPSGLAIAASLPSHAAAQARAIGVWGAATAAAAPAGALAGGALIEVAGWRSTLLLVGGLPVAVALFLPPSAAAPRRRVPIGLRPWAGALLLPVACGLLVFVATGADRAQLASRLPFAAIAVAALAGWALVQATAARPLLPLRELRDRRLTSAAAVALPAGGSLLAMAFFAQQHLQTVLGMGPAVAGIAYAPVGVAFAVAARPAAAFAARQGPRIVVGSGLVLGAAALMWLAGGGAGGGYWPHVLGPLVVTGVSLGLVYVGLTVAAVGRIDAGRRGLGAGAVNTCWQLGGVLGLAAAVAVLSPGSAMTPMAVRDAFALEAGLALGGAVVALLLEPAAKPDVDTGAGHRDGDR